MLESNSIVKADLKKFVEFPLQYFNVLKVLTKFFRGDERLLNSTR